MTATDGQVLTPEQLGRMTARVTDKIGPASAIVGQNLKEKGLARAIIDSIQSTGVRYRNVENVLFRYRSYREAAGGDVRKDGTRELLATFDELGGPAGWARTIGNKHKTSTAKGAPLKSVAVQAAAQVLDAHEIHVSEDLRELAQDAKGLAEVGEAWRCVVGQRSGITWRYALMLAAVPGVKPDRMIIRFVADALDVPNDSVKADFAVAAVTETAKNLKVDVTGLDHCIWQYQRNPKRDR